ncbi:hypothetical protein [Dechloromonas denitrificans]|uniref:hypothetical protein n=1 Tax=Dechloromonas denitrificans TaxID=281362 RepID=UPI001CF8D833|nr:hypothetical protein [Dechloromonas denitrificans]UCV03384.1 hypothetical protein KI611_20355 [Dechloromonas denitrificans]
MNKAQQSKDFPFSLNRISHFCPPQNPKSCCSVIVCLAVTIEVSIFILRSPEWFEGQFRKRNVSAPFGPLPLQGAGGFVEGSETMWWREVLLDQLGVEGNAIETAQAAEQPQRGLGLNRPPGADISLFSTIYGARMVAKA